MPHYRELPESLSTLTRLNVLRLGHASWEDDILRLITVIDGKRSARP